MYLSTSWHINIKERLPFKINWYIFKIHCCSKLKINELNLGIWLHTHFLKWQNQFKKYPATLPSPSSLLTDAHVVEELWAFKTWAVLAI